MAAPLCGVANIRLNCYAGTVLDPIRRKALLIYLMACELKGIGGTDYTSALISGSASGLIGAATQGLQQVTDDLIGKRTIGQYELGIAHNNAVASGGTVATDINTRMQQIKCLLNVDEKTLDLCYVWLLCQLGVSKSYPQ